MEDQAVWFHKPLEEETNADGENSKNKVNFCNCKVILCWLQFSICHRLSPEGPNKLTGGGVPVSLPVRSLKQLF